MKHPEVATALANTLGKEVGDLMYGKGGFFVRGGGFISLAKARRMTGIKGPKRNPRLIQPAWGEYAIIAMLNKPRKMQ